MDTPCTVIDGEHQIYGYGQPGVFFIFYPDRSSMCSYPSSGPRPRGYPYLRRRWGTSIDFACPPHSSEIVMFPSSSGGILPDGVNEWRCEFRTCVCRAVNCVSVAGMLRLYYRRETDYYGQCERNPSYAVWMSVEFLSGGQGSSGQLMTTCGSSVLPISGL